MVDKTYKIFTDGGSRGNPGPASCGAVVFQGLEKKADLAKFLGEMTNNQAEYHGVLLALDWLEKNKVKNASIKFNLDSKLVVEQLSGNYKLKNEGLKTLFWQIREKIISLGLTINFKHIPREKNIEADRLVNEALDLLNK
ncbi:MAG: ribonuclease HI family protein [Patescibacteria group bacterium]